MTKEQESAFWDTIKAFKELDILRNIMIIGSWAEYLYTDLFKTDFYPNLRTRDVDFFYRNINIPKEKVPLVQKLKEIGYVYDEVDGISRFYKEDFLEIEFLTKVLGAGTEGKIRIKPLGITSEGLRVINILSDFACTVRKILDGGLEYEITVPEPAVYVIQKILTNPTREPEEKKAKDISAVQELLYHIKKDDYHFAKLHEVCKVLSKKQLKTLESVCSQYGISMFD
ncbi:MAG: hypothetical protein IJ530_15525 [Treponema sp.]|uniref:GSU2403 family nucleotidyltransferase fold protein n=1 Tax=Treponema sp. TaxID=166 RepID=UPI0025EA2A49|nr:GSU2403 family nucleotidyltransferase fold protein [Treponema sp.]MBQ8681141.1 hypothetical protein [Treponema sp.]